MEISIGTVVTLFLVWACFWGPWSGIEPQQPIEMGRSKVDCDACGVDTDGDLIRRHGDTSWYCESCFESLDSAEIAERSRGLAKGK